MLSVIQLACMRGERALFSDVGFTLERGEWLHVRGDNGVGKTSLLRILAGLSPAASGIVLWQDAPIHRAAEDYRQQMCFLGHANALKEELTARENLACSLALDGMRPKASELEAALARFGLRSRADLPVRFFSAGQKRRALLARLTLRRAPLWLLDEPFTALDSAAIALLGEVIAAHVAAGGLAVLTSHQAPPLTGGRELQL